MGSYFAKTNSTRAGIKNNNAAVTASLSEYCREAFEGETWEKSTIFIGAGVTGQARRRLKDLLWLYPWLQRGFSLRAVDRFCN